MSLLSAPTSLVVIQIHEPSRNCWNIPNSRALLLQDIIRDYSNYRSVLSDHSPLSFITRIGLESVGWRVIAPYVDPLCYLHIQELSLKEMDLASRPLWILQDIASAAASIGILFPLIPAWRHDHSCFGHYWWCHQAWCQVTDSSSGSLILSYDTSDRYTYQDHKKRTQISKYHQQQIQKSRK